MRGRNWETVGDSSTSAATGLDQIKGDLSRVRISLRRRLTGGNNGAMTSAGVGSDYSVAVVPSRSYPRCSSWIGSTRVSLAWLLDYYTRTHHFVAPRFLSLVESTVERCLSPFLLNYASIFIHPSLITSELFLLPFEFSKRRALPG